MKLEFLDVAEAEFIEAVTYYNEQSEGLGYEFAAEVRRTIGRIIQYPEAWSPFPTGRDGVVQLSFHMVSFTKSEKTLF